MCVCVWGGGWGGGITLRLVQDMTWTLLHAVGEWFEHRTLVQLWTLSTSQTRSNNVVMEETSSENQTDEEAFSPCASGSGASVSSDKLVLK